jgi:hypothetical protein
MSDYPRRLNLIILAGRLDDARTLVAQELQGVAQAVRDQTDLFLATLATAAEPTVVAARGLSGVVTENQWQALLDIRSRIPASWRSSFFAAPGPTADNPSHNAFWIWAAGLGFVPLQEDAQSEMRAGR